MIRRKYLFSNPYVKKNTDKIRQDKNIDSNINFKFLKTTNSVT